ncbi:MAG: flagellar export chaperone FlgN [Nitrospinae bacterium]|nr:flagellar export chaperone FlgN [Nitrospinota bacterium]
MSELIFNYLREELNCYEEILSLSNRQKDAIVNVNEDILMEIIKEKDILIEEVKEIDKNLGNVINKKKGVFDNSADMLLKKIEASLNEINKIENECREIVANRMKDISHKMKELRTGKQIANIYLEKSIYTPKFINMKK